MYPGYEIHKNSNYFFTYTYIYASILHEKLIIESDLAVLKGHNIEVVV